MSNLRLSEAIRLGAMAVPEVHGPAYRRGSDGRVCGVCAIGAAMFAAGLIPESRRTWLPVSHMDPEVSAAFPLLLADVTNPVTESPSYVRAIVIGLFERHNWTRERIADWVESIEAQQDAAQPQTEQEVTACL